MFLKKVFGSSDGQIIFKCHQAYIRNFPALRKTLSCGDNPKHGFNPTWVSSNRALIGSHHKSIKYSTNESMILLKTWVFSKKNGVLECPLRLTLKDPGGGLL